MQRAITQMVVLNVYVTTDLQEMEQHAMVRQTTIIHKTVLINHYSQAMEA